MAWCEANGVHFLFGLAKNHRLIAEIKTELDQAAVQSRRTGKPARRFKDFRWTTRSSWSRRRRVVTLAVLRQRAQSATAPRRKRLVKIMAQCPGCARPARALRRRGYEIVPDEE